MRLLNADKITKDSDLIITMIDMFKSCKMKHTDNCLADDCYECASRYFKNTYAHIQPIVTQDTIERGNDNDT